MLGKILRFAAVAFAVLLALVVAGAVFAYFAVNSAVLGEDRGRPSVLRYAETPPENAPRPADPRAYDFDPRRFADPGRKLGPMTRWWWPGADVTAGELEREVAMIADNGFAGVEIQPFTMGLNPQADEDERDRVLSWDTNGFYEKLRAVLAQAAARDLIVDLNAGSGWPTGGPQIALEDNFRTLLYTEKTVTGGGETRWELEPPDAPFSAYLSLLMGLMGNNAPGVYYPLEAEPVAVTAARLVRDERSRWIWNVRDQVALDPDSAVDLTARLDGRTLRWQAPEGEWRLIAFWSLPNGETPSLIATPDPGLVVDHFAPDKVRANYDYLFGSRTGLPEHFGRPVRAIFNDSYEFKADRHFTADFLEEFERRRGYDLRPWLPAVMQPGYNHMLAHILTPHAEPDFTFSAQDRRIRYDYDLTLSELLAERFLDTSSEWMRERGLLHRTQAYGMPMDVIAAAGRADIPETEQLYWGGSEAFLKAVSSGAWLYGRPIVAAESVVYMGREYMSTPQKIKISVDKAFTAGVNQIIYHGTAYRYQTDDFGTEGWYPWSSPFVPMLGFSSDLRESNPFWRFVPRLNDYIARSQYALRSGRPAADVLVYYPFLGFTMNGQEMNPEELLPEGEWQGREPPLDPPPGLPFSPQAEVAKTPEQEWFARVWETLNTLEEHGVTWAWVNDESLREAEVAGSRWRIRGASFQALVLPHVPHMPVETAERVRELAEAGARVALVGEAPSLQPGFRDYAKRDAAVAESFLGIDGLASVVALADADGLRGWSGTVRGPVRYAEPYRHLRRIDRVMTHGGRVVFLRSKSDEWSEIRLQLAGPLRSAVWLDPADGSLAAFGDGTYALPPYGSVLLYATPGRAPAAPPARQAEGESVAELTSWTLETGALQRSGVEPGDWRDDPDLRLAGQAVYRTAIELPEIEPGVRYVLDLGDVSAVAEVEVNGADAGAAIFAPFVLDVTDLLQPGANELSVRVTAPALNPLIFRAEQGDHRYRQLASKEPLPAGLLGPVALRRIAEDR